MTVQEKPFLLEQIEEQIKQLPVSQLLDLLKFVSLQVSTTVTDQLNLTDQYIYDDSEISDHEWLRAASKNPAFDFLNDPKEDIYTLEDGEPFQDEG